MDIWTLEQAKNGFSEVVRRALEHEPQLVTLGRPGEDAVVIAREDYERLLAPRNLAAFLQQSPLAEAMAEGAFGDPDGELFPRSREVGRPVDW